MSPIRCGASLVLTVAAAATLAHAQQPGTYRGGAELVSVYATVTDRDGRFVRDLTKDDFAIEDNGRRQPITVFSSEPQPITVVVMLDCSGSMAVNAGLVRQGAGAFVDRLLPADRVRIGNFAREIRLAPAAFTTDRVILRDVLETDLQDMGPSPVWTAVDRSITALKPEAGRRVILLFSDGHDETDVGQVVTDVKDVVHRARYNGILIYVIAFPKAEGLRTQFAPDGIINAVKPSIKTKKPHAALKSLASESGGGYFELRPDDPLGPTFERVADDLHHQYWLGFAAPALDGRVHAIDVSVRRRNVSVRARRSYVADAGR